MASVTAGLAGGVVATIVMTIAMMVMGDGGPPPTARLVARFAGGDPEDYAMPGMALHFVYGIVAGAVFAVGVPSIGLDLGSIVVAVGIGLGLVMGERRSAQLLYSVGVLALFGSAVFLPEHPATTVAKLAVGSPTSTTFALVGVYVAFAVVLYAGVRRYVRTLSADAL